MQIIEDNPSYCHNAGNNINADGCYWRIPGKRTWAERAADLHQNPSKMPSGLRKAGL